MKTILNMSKIGIVLVLIMTLGTFSARANYTVMDMLNDGNYLWICYGNSKLVRYDKTTQDTVEYPLAVGTYPQHLAKDAQGNIWVTTNPGIAKFNGTSFEFYDLTNYGLWDNHAQQIFIDGSNNIWIGLVGFYYLVKYDGTTWQNWRIVQNSAAPFISDMYMDKNDVLWVAGSTATLDGFNFGYFDGTKIVSLLSSPWASINGMVVDKNGVFWLASDGDGLIKYDGTAFTYFNTRNSNIPYNGFSDVEVDAVGNIWISRGLELVKFDGANYTVYSIPPAEFSIKCLKADTNGDIWIGTRASNTIRGKLFRYSAEQDTIVEVAFSNAPSSLEKTRIKNIVVSIYPNPASEFIHVQINDNQHTFQTVNVYDITGRLTSSNSINENSSDFTLDALNIHQDGWFIVEVITSKATYRAKLLVNRK